MFHDLIHTNGQFIMPVRFVLSTTVWPAFITQRTFSRVETAVISASGSPSTATISTRMNRASVVVMVAHESRRESQLRRRLRSDVPCRSRVVHDPTVDSFVS